MNNKILIENNKPKQLNFKKNMSSLLKKPIETISPSKNNNNNQTEIQVVKTKQKLTLIDLNSNKDSFTTSHTICDTLQDQKWKKDDFQLIRQLGKGKFGYVYAARQKKSNYIVAIKRMNKQQLEKNSFDKRIKKQIQIQSYLKHQNILRLYGFFWDDIHIYLILEYAPGGELYKELKSNKKLDERRTANIIKQVCEGLIYLHSKKITHRDIKPENLLVSFDKIKIADFGWSIYSKSRRQTICGTLDYLAPEMVKGESYDHCIDIWAVGILCFQLNAGFPPFQTPSYEDTYEKICSNEIEFPQQFSQNLKQFIQKLLMKNSKERMQLKQAIKHNWILQNYKN